MPASLGPRNGAARAAPAIEEAIYNQEEANAGARFTYFMTGLSMLLPALIKFADPDVSRQLTPRAVRGEELWCQLFSEPSSGSDSAGARCAAVRQGDDWVINGQKVWNSGAHHADYGMLLTRTDPTVPKHKGLTMFWVDMKTPGIDVRPIHQMSGDSELNEVFLTDVRIPDSQRIGEVGAGWAVTMATLGNERAAIGTTGLSWPDIMELAGQVAAGDETMLQDDAFRERLADWYVNFESLRLLNFQTLTALSKGLTPGPEASAGKVLWANQTQDLSNQGIEIQDLYGLISDPDQALVQGAFQHRLLWAPGLRLGGGADEILKNIIAERVLGLPGDVRVDKNVPFKDIPSGR